MDKDELLRWALANGWTMIGDCPSLTKPSRPSEAIARMILKATVANIEIKKPAGKWEKISGVPYSRIEADPETGFPRGLGLDTISGFAALMEDNKNRAVFAKFAAKPRDV
jgi:hypothetical protein